jgi:hypothetical protein
MRHAHAHACRKRFGLDACNETPEPNAAREEENCARVWYESMNCVERAPADEKEKDRAARERALADRRREKATLLAERGIDFSLAFPAFFAALPADVRAQRRVAHTKAVDGYTRPSPHTLTALANRTHAHAHNRTTRTAC